MVFTKLSVQEKDAFFALLDEYFRSRPELFGSASGPGLAGTGVSPAAAASVVQRALAANAGGASSATKSNNPYAASMSAVTGAMGMAANRNDHRGDGVDANEVGGVASIGRVAAASLAFSGGLGNTQTSSSSSSAAAAGAPTLPRRAGNVPATSTTDQPGEPGAEVDKLVTKKASVFNAFKKPPAAGVVIPSAFVAPRNAYGAPPVRRTTSETGTGAVGGGSGSGSGSGRGVATGPTRAVAPAPPPREEVADGEWAEVLYDYTSEDAADLTIEAGTRVLVTAKSSEDWWTGKVEGQGKEGLVPASYVKLL